MIPIVATQFPKILPTTSAFSFFFFFFYENEKQVAISERYSLTLTKRHTSYFNRKLFTIILKLLRFDLISATFCLLAYYSSMLNYDLQKDARAKTNSQYPSTGYIADAAWHEVFLLPISEVIASVANMNANQ